jgi:hypothetical protein
MISAGIRLGLLHSFVTVNYARADVRHPDVVLNFHKAIRRSEQSLVALSGLSRTAWVWQGKPGDSMGVGREAVTLRQLILVVVLVAAAFLGGVFVNGPGLRWAQTRLLRSVGWTEGDIVLIDLKPTASADPTADGAGSSKVQLETLRGPLAPMPSLITEEESAKRDMPDALPASLDRRRPEVSNKAPVPAQPPLASSLSSRSSTGLIPKTPSPVPAPRDVDIKPTSASPLPVLSRAPAFVDLDIAPALLDALAAFAPLVPPSSSSPSRSSATHLLGDGNDNWSGLMSKMRTLGVTRFMIEGEVGGRVVFACLIPLAGRQAVAQRFEAEGDDIAQAAQAALRRIVLWRASQVTSR